MMNIKRQLPQMIAILRRWGAASGLWVNGSKTQLVTVGREAAARQIVQRLEHSSDIQVIRSAKYLGVCLGPDAPEDQWKGVLAKMRGRVQDIRVQGHSLAARIYMFNIYVTNLFLYVGRFVQITPDARKAYAHAIQQITKAPWQTYTAQLMHNITVLGMPGEVRDIDAELLCAQGRAALSSQVLCDVRHRIDARARTNEATLNPRRNWHKHSPIEVASKAVGTLAQDRRTSDVVRERRLGDLRKALRPTVEEKWGLVAPLLLRRARRWTEEPQELLVALRICFLKIAPSQI